jgi:hypothetical protein
MTKKRVMKASPARTTRATATTFAAVPGYAVLYPQLKMIVDYIVQEILAEMNQAVQGEGKSFSATALDEWTPKLSASVFTRLMDDGDWAKDRTNVLAVAHDMAVIAAIISGSSPTVSKGRVHAAFRAVKDHDTCPGDSGEGRWCDFDI